MCHHIGNDGPFDKRLSPCLPGGNVGDMYGELFPWFTWCKSGCWAVMQDMRSTECASSGTVVLWHLALMCVTSVLRGALCRIILVKCLLALWSLCCIHSRVVDSEVNNVACCGWPIWGLVLDYFLGEVAILGVPEFPQESHALCQ